MTTPKREELTIEQAAQRLGLQLSGVKARIKRGKLVSRVNAEGLRVVVVDESTPAKLPSPFAGSVQDKGDYPAESEADLEKKSGANIDGRSPAYLARLLAHLEDEVKYLREQQRDSKRERSELLALISHLASPLPHGVW